MTCWKGLNRKIGWQIKKSGLKEIYWERWSVSTYLLIMCMLYRNAEMNVIGKFQEIHHFADNEQHGERESFCALEFRPLIDQNNAQSKNTTIISSIFEIWIISIGLTRISRPHQNLNNFSTNFCYECFWQQNWELLVRNVSYIYDTKSIDSDINRNKRMESICSIRYSHCVDVVNVCKLIFDSCCCHTQSMRDPLENAISLFFLRNF